MGHDVAGLGVRRLTLFAYTAVGARGSTWRCATEAAGHTSNVSTSARSALSGAIARGGAHPSAFASREIAYSLLVVGIAEMPGVEEHAAAILAAMRP